MVLFTSEFESKSFVSSPLPVSSENILCKQFVEEFASKVHSVPYLSFQYQYLHSQSVCFYIMDYWLLTNSGLTVSK